MPSYCAHLLMAVRLRSGPQDVIPVYENVHLIDSDDPDEAFAIAEKIGREQDALDDPGLTLNDQPARMTFVGIRKLISVRQAHPDRPSSGDELTYSEFNVSGEADLVRLVAGDNVQVEYLA